MPAQREDAADSLRHQSRSLPAAAIPNRHLLPHAGRWCELPVRHCCDIPLWQQPWSSVSETGDAASHQARVDRRLQFRLPCAKLRYDKLVPLGRTIAAPLREPAPDCEPIECCPDAGRTPGTNCPAIRLRGGVDSQTHRNVGRSQMLSDDRGSEIWLSGDRGQRLLNVERVHLHLQS